MDRTRLSLLAGFLIALPFVGLAVLATTQAVWLPLLQDDAVSKIAFVVIAATLSGLACVSAQVAAVVSGFAFGFVPGALFASIAVCGGGLVGYIALRPLTNRSWQRIVARRPLAQSVHEALLVADRKTATTVTTLLRLSPVMPFAGTNMLMAAAGVPLIPFLVGTLLGFAPLALAASFAGATLAELRLDGGAAPAIWVTLALLLGSAVGICFVARRQLSRRFRERKNAVDEDDAGPRQRGSNARACS